MRNSQLAFLNSQILTRKLELATRKSQNQLVDYNSQLANFNSQNQLALYNSQILTRNSQNQLATRNSQLALATINSQIIQTPENHINSIFTGLFEVFLSLPPPARVKNVKDPLFASNPLTSVCE